MNRFELTTFVVWAAVAACGCMDLSLLDDMVPLDAGGQEDTSQSDSQDGDDGDDQDDGDGDEGDDEIDDGDDESLDTDPNDTDPPTPSPAACGPDEEATAVACTASGPVSVSLRFVTDEPASVQVSVPGPARAALLSDEWATEHHVVVTDLAEPAPVPVTMGVSDVNGNYRDTVTSVSGLGGPAVAITEVLADPNGAEPGQEFVEVVNFGGIEVDLGGWMIDDNLDANGDLIPAGSVLVPGAVAILVSPAYDPHEGLDPSPDPQAMMFVLDSSIGTSGLKNSEAETIELYDASGALISRYSGQAGKPVPGCSAVRRYAELPDGDALAFGCQPEGTSTPGAILALP